MDSSGHTVRGSRSRRSRALKKNLFTPGYRKWLSHKNAYRHMQSAFAGDCDYENKPPEVSVEDQLCWAALREDFRRQGGRPKKDDPVRIFGMKRKSLLFRLPYWHKLPVRHILDVMHIEKNIAENIMKHLSGERDTLATRQDMEQANVMHDLGLSREAGSNVYRKPHAPYVFTDAERVKFMKQISGTRTPTGYSATLTKHVGEDKLSQLKSHDYHLLLQ